MWLSISRISHWDHERERMVILTKKSIWIVKYDFIAMRIIEKERHELNKFDTIQIGLLTYPSSSIVPWVNGIEVFVLHLYVLSPVWDNIIMTHLLFSCAAYWILTLLSKLEGLTNGVGSLFTGEIFKKSDKTQENNENSQGSSNGNKERPKPFKRIIQCIPSQVDLHQFHSM